MKRHLWLAVVLTACSPVPFATAQDSFGTIKGKVTFEGDPPAPEVLVKQGDPGVTNAAVCAKTTLYSRELAVDGQSKGVAHCWVYLVNPQGSNPVKLEELKAKTPEVVVDQVNCEFTPYCTPIIVGQQTLVLKSSDPVNHNTRGNPLNSAKNKPFNISLPGNSQVKLNFGDKERAPTELKCDIHPWMKGWIFMFDHPFHAVTDKEGNFEITGVPAGTQNLVVRFPNGKVINAGKLKGDPVEVKGGGTLEVNFTAK